MLTNFFLVAIGFFMMVAPSYSQSTSLEKTKALFNKSYPKLESHQLLFLVKPSNEKLHSKKLLLTDSLEKCLIITQEGQQYQTTCRYFILEDQIEIFEEKNRYILQANQIQAIKIADRIFVCKSYSFGGSIFYGYFQLLTEGKFNLLKKYTTKIKKHTHDPLPLIEAYYYQKAKDIFPTKFKLKKKSIAPCFANEALKWNAYYKKVKPNLNAEADLIKIFQYFNQTDTVQTSK